MRIAAASCIACLTGAAISGVGGPAISGAPTGLGRKARRWHRHLSPRVACGWRAVRRGAAASFPDRSSGVVQSGRFMGYTESGQSRANQGIPRFACNPDLNHADGTFA